jgi:hypothetical protein
MWAWSALRLIKQNPPNPLLAMSSGIEIESCFALLGKEADSVEAEFRMVPHVGKCPAGLPRLFLTVTRAVS